MDKGNGVQNPYAGVNIPRAQLKSSFVRNAIGEDLDGGVVITNPNAVPSYTSYTTSSDRVITLSPSAAGTTWEGNTISPTATNWEDNKVNTQDSWRRPYNPYAGTDKPQNGGHPNSMYTIDLDKQCPREPVKSESKSVGCCCPCCDCCGPCNCCGPCCPCCSCCGPCCCCGKPCCVIS